MIIEDYPMKRLQVPALVDLLSPTNVRDYPYDAVYEDAKNDPIFVLHTSGSTGQSCACLLLGSLLTLVGIPKPLVYTHMFNTCVANITSLPMQKNFINLNANFQTGNFFSIFPSFHVSKIDRHMYPLETITCGNRSSA